MIKTMAEIKKEHPTMENLVDYVVDQLVKDRKKEPLIRIINEIYSYDSLLEFTFLHLNK